VSVRKLALWVLTGIALLPSVARADGRSYLDISAGYMTGDFDTPTTSHLYSLAPTLGYVASRHDFSVTLPYLTLQSESGTTRQTENGIGDIIVRAGAVLFPESAGGFTLNGSLAIKLPTADETKGLGTGETDYGAFASAQQRLGAFKLLLTTGYLIIGNPPGLDYQNIFSYGISLSRRFAVTSVYGSFESRQTVISGYDNPQELSAGFFHALNPDYAIKGHFFFGLNNGGPDGGGNLGIVRWF